MDSRPTIVVIGLGYVGLPLAVALATKFDCWGVDISATRISELQAGFDRTGEIDTARMTASSLHVTANPDDCPPADFYIVTVPTPIDAHNKPDLSLVVAASRTVGRMLDGRRKPIVIFESTVYPGVTEEICAPELAAISGLVCGEDFFLGYSPERINPGDREHTIDKITKVVSGQTPEVLDKISDLYGAVTSGGVFRAASIRAAEAAKVIENAQRDINIAFMNEIAQIFGSMGLSIWDVLEAAGTKWNFLNFSPGLVGGHCIGVDPFYLSHRAEQLGHNPRVILSGRSINDGMAEWIADRLHAARDNRPGSVLILGLTFKENVPDLRNSKVADLIAGLVKRGHTVKVHDPHADAAEAMHEYGLSLCKKAFDCQYDLVVLAVPHQEYMEMDGGVLAGLVAERGILADLKNGLGRSADDFPCRVWHL
ncbi:nucleotide sugar dehydrogenase [Sphingomonas lacunae]|uniref:nucleotide sugar dehydrogenase n=1 Tax=Sphingomonas lacunae TaxID=2698828 RepID=UPI001FEC7C1D|nr:nucleotide sugar dehydrogenase [Sphingomonas lacunae]